MKAKVKVNGTHQGSPLDVDIEIEFEKGEYLEVVKAMPAIVGQIKALVNKERAAKREEKQMRKNAKQFRQNRKG